MREILFRAKRKDNGEWFGGFYFQKPNPTTKDGLPIYHGISDLPPFGVEVIPETVGQYTGLTDKNGNKIFEGDIVKNSCCVTLRSGDNENKWGCTIMGVVTFREGGFRVNSSELDFPVSNEYEVIGNVIDNPELLEVK